MPREVAKAAGVALFFLPLAVQGRRVFHGGVSNPVFEAAGCASFESLRRTALQLAALAAVALSLGACFSALMREEDVESLNEEFEGRVYTATQDITTEFNTTDDGEEEVVYPRGTRLHVRVESQGDWLRVRAWPADESLEYNPGRVIIYEFRDIMEEDGRSEEIIDRYPPERLRARILEILQPAGSPS